MPMYLYLGDITRMETDAIVNAAGTDLRRCPGHLRRDFRRRRHGGAGEGVPEAGPLPHRAGGGHAGLRAALPVHHSRGRAGLVRWGAPGAVPAGRVLPERPA